MSKRTPLILVVFVAVSLLSACSGDDKSKKAGKAHLVEVATVLQQPLEYTSDRPGTLRAQREVKLFNQEEGRVTAVLARGGDQAREYRPLIRLDARLLQAELDKADAQLRQAELNVTRLQRLIPEKLVSDDTLTRAQTELDVAKANVRMLQTRVSYMTVRAPFYGEVAERLVEPGDVAPKHTHLMTLVDSSSLVTEVQVSELMLSRIKRGERADVRIDALGSKIYQGKVSRIYPTIDPSTRLGRLEVALSPVPEGARAGQFCRVVLYSQAIEPIVIPFSALRRDPQGEYVFVVTEGDKVNRQAIVSGLRLTDRVEVIDGLMPGQVVVKKGFLGLAVGDKVKVVNQSSSEKTGAQAVAGKPSATAADSKTPATGDKVK